MIAFVGGEKIGEQRDLSVSRKGSESLVMSDRCHATWIGEIISRVVANKKKILDTNTCNIHQLYIYSSVYKNLPIVTKKRHTRKQALAD